MHKVALRVLLEKIALTITVLVACAVPVSVQSQQDSSEQRTARHFESIRKTPPELVAFLFKMPKGADLHNHLSGSIYAETYIEWVAKTDLCLDTRTLKLFEVKPPAICDPKKDQMLARDAANDSVLYRRMIDAWSMRNWQLSGDSGHDHFFDAFAKSSPATWNNMGKMLAELVESAARSKVLYVEVMLTPDGTATGVKSIEIARDKNLKIDENNYKAKFEEVERKIIAQAVPLGKKNLKEAETEKDAILKCGTPEKLPGCSVEVRYIAQVGRNGAPGEVFAQMITGLALATDPKSGVVGVNLVQGEDGVNSLKYFSTHMEMLRFLKEKHYRGAPITLHAGELVPGLVPPKDLRFHIRESVMIAGAKRIGHGVDIMYENEPYEILKKMADDDVMVEICLTSNDVILGVTGARHPLLTYMKYGVPVALATDDEGIARSELSLEFLKAAEDQGLGYLQLKTMARNSLEYAFIDGKSLWRGGREFIPVAECASDLAVNKLTSNACQLYIKNNEKAKLQLKLEEDFKTFESEVVRRSF